MIMEKVLLLNYRNCPECMSSFSAGPRGSGRSVHESRGETISVKSNTNFLTHVNQKICAKTKEIPVGFVWTAENRFEKALGVGATLGVISLTLILQYM